VRRRAEPKASGIDVLLPTSRGRDDAGRRGRRNSLWTALRYEVRAVDHHSIRRYEIRIQLGSRTAACRADRDGKHQWDD
jgi:hypothetical protein